MMFALHHKLLALLNGIHHLFKDNFGGFFVGELEGFFEANVQQRTLLFELKSPFSKGTPKPVDDHGNNNWFVIFYNKRCPLPARGKGLSSPLRKGDDPVLLQCPANLSGVTRIQTTSHFF